MAKGDNSDLAARLRAWHQQNARSDAQQNQHVRSTGRGDASDRPDLRERGYVRCLVCNQWAQPNEEHRDPGAQGAAAKFHKVVPDVAPRAPGTPKRFPAPSKLSTTADAEREADLRKRGYVRCRVCNQWAVRNEEHRDPGAQGAAGQFHKVVPDR